ncbi:MAG TPA: aldo/keto reductase [Mariniphaga sp.]|nr:aldo/keto reductase [Mariniphaga sp.]
MEKISIPGSELRLSPLAFGAWAIGGWFWGGTEENKSLRAVQSAIENGMTTIDTAPVYGFGQSEEFVGKAIMGKREKVQILTKFGLRWDKSSSYVHYEKTKDNQGNELTIYRSGRKESIIEECENSLKRLKTDHIDLYQQHWPDPHTPIEETMEAIEILKKQGKILAAGVSNFSVPELEKAQKYGRLISNQVPYNMLNREIEIDLVPYCIANSLSIIAYSPMQRGLLTGKITKDYKFNEGDNRPDTPLFKEKNLIKINKFLREINGIAKSKNATLAQIVLRWTMYQPGITCVLAGARTESQVFENIKASDIHFSCDEMKLINTKFNYLAIELQNQKMVVN